MQIDEVHEISDVVEVKHLLVHETQIQENRTEVETECGIGFTIKSGARTRTESGKEVSVDSEIDPYKSKNVASCARPRLRRVVRLRSPTRRSTPAVGGMEFKRATHVLFDMDGLILNTEDLYTIGFQQLASRYDKEFTFALKCKIMGKQTKEFAKDIIEDLELPLSVDEFVTETKAIFNDLFPTCELKLGAKKLIVHLHKHNVPIGLATSSSIESYELKTQNHKELFDLFSCYTWGSSDPDVKRGKPHPDVFLVAAGKFPTKPKPEDCLVFEDSLNGVTAARAAGMQVVMVPDPHLDKALASEATLVVNTLLDFQPELFGLPPYDP
ncbi:Pseudouridine-5'-phosphatase [Eumeta japonica]|uniref:pseudouridine 5'-phosphatase n=1 Tax=Eumeta variegata TaxID=151549 RepID=A0A4C1VCA4_EUMVA|nr:Pseudouridine-5'-phosphatase [Eumeta japonica]